MSWADALGSLSKVVAASETKQETSLPITAITPDPNQPRKTFDPVALEELAASIRAEGILQPIVVRPADHTGIYQIISGERRFRAAKLAGLVDVPVSISDRSADSIVYAQMIENIQREDLNPADFAFFFESETARGIKPAQIAQRLGISRAKLSAYTSLSKLPEELREMVKSLPYTTIYEVYLAHKEAPETVAEFVTKTDPAAITKPALRALITQTKDTALEGANPVIPAVNTESGSVEEREVPPSNTRTSEGPEKPDSQKAAVSQSVTPATDPNVRGLEEEMSNLLGLRVSITPNDFRVKYTNLDQLDSILSRLRTGNPSI